MPSCSDLSLDGVRRLAPERAAFDLATDGRTLAAVYREERLVVLHSLSPDGAELARFPVERGEPEEVLHLAGTSDYLVTVVLSDTDASGSDSELLRVGPEGSRRLGGSALCAIASMAWEAEDGSVLLGCENEPQVQRYRPLQDTISPPLPSGVTQGLEDMVLDASSLFVVPLVMGSAIQELDRETLTLARTRALGGFAYQVRLDPTRRRLFVSRFVDGAVLAIDADELTPTEHGRVAFGVRPLEVFAERGLVAAGSMMHTGPWLLDADTLRGRRLDLGGLSKGLAQDPSGATLYASTTCGLLALDLDRLR